MCRKLNSRNVFVHLPISYAVMNIRACGSTNCCPKGNFVFTSISYWYALSSSIYTYIYINILIEEVGLTDVGGHRL